MKTETSLRSCPALSHRRRRRAQIEFEFVESSCQFSGSGKPITPRRVPLCGVDGGGLRGCVHARVALYVRPPATCSLRRYCVTLLPRTPYPLSETLPVSARRTRTVGVALISLAWRGPCLPVASWAPHRFLVSSDQVDLVRLTARLADCEPDARWHLTASLRP